MQMSAKFDIEISTAVALSDRAPAAPGPIAQYRKLSALTHLMSLADPAGNPIPATAIAAILVRDGMAQPARTLCFSSGSRRSWAGVMLALVPPARFEIDASLSALTPPSSTISAIGYNNSEY